MKTDELIKSMKKPCFCGKESLAVGPINQVSITESGQIVEPYRNKDTYASYMIPMCPYHIVMAQNGFIAASKEHGILKGGIVERAEALTDLQLKRSIMKFGRGAQTKEAKSIKRLCKTIIEARKFEETINRPLTKKEEALLNKVQNDKN